MSDNLIIISLEQAKMPKFIERKATPWIIYGEDNKYPEYLLELFTQSAKHGAIVKGKAGYIAGEGWEGAPDKIGVMGEPIKKLTRKAAMDLEMYGGFYLEVVWSAMGKIGSVRHVDYTNYRIGKDEFIFYRKKDWSNSREEAEIIPAFSKFKKQGKQILYVKEYRPGMEAYSLPGYISALNWICADIEVGKHVLNNSKSGFTPSKLINFNNGEPTEEEKKKIEKRIKEKFTGAEGLKFMLSFNRDKSVAPDVLDLGASDITKEDFSHIDKLIQQNIYAGHLITSPMLFGIRVEGQLGGSTELSDAYEIFKNTYISSKQQLIEEAISELTESDCKIIPMDPIGAKPAAPAPMAQAADAIAAPPKLNPYTNMPTALSEEDAVAIISEYGQPREKYGIIKSRPFLFQEEFELAEQITRQEADILELIRKDPKITPAIIAKTTGQMVTEVENVISRLIDRGALKAASVKVGEDTVTQYEIPKATEQAVKEAAPRTREISVKYSYEVKPGVGPEIIPTTRPFCARLLELNRIYTRKEIEAMSIRLGYNVFERKGGWWGNRPECRHQWIQNVVISNE